MGLAQEAPPTEAVAAMSDEHLEGLLPPDQPQLTVQVTIRDGETLIASLNVPVESMAAWRLYHEAVASLFRPTAILHLPEMTSEEAERLRASWGDRLKR